MSEILQKRIIKQWRKEVVGIISTMYPEDDKKDIKKFVNEKIVDNFKQPNAILHNNYIHKKQDIDLISIGDWIHDKKPIVGGYGVFFNDQSKVINPAAIMLDNFLNLRKMYKDELKIYHETSYEYATSDRKQLTEKVNANSYYGVSGSPTSNFYNIYTAASTTATGQSLISTTETAFEGFMSNNNPFIDLDDCMNFLRFITKEKDDRKFSTRKILPRITVEMLIGRLKTMFYDYKEEYEFVLFSYLINLHEEEISRIYFKNNLYEFSNLPRIRYILSDIVMKADKFRDPNKVPSSIAKELDELWDYYKEFVLYNNFYFNRIQRLKNDKRKTVVTVDTDSNMLNLEPWYNFMMEYVIGVKPEIVNGKTDDDVMYICINIMSYIITKMITEVLNKYTKKANVPKEYRHRVNMKNEFLFTRLILADKKKRYMSSIRLREGKEVLPEKIDIKGHDFAKSSARPETMEFFKKLAKERLLYTDNIDIPSILADINQFHDDIDDSLKRGERNFLLPKSVKELGAYKDPFREMGVRAVFAWNAIYPENSIELPEKIDIVKVNLERLSDVEKLLDKYPEIYEKIVSGIFESKIDKIREKGVSAIAIPRNVDKVPEWITEFMDCDTIINDNISKFHSVLRSLGLNTIKTSKKEYYSNIISF